MATRTNRQLKVVLAGQGMDKEAAKFAYRGQVTNRKYLRVAIGEEENWRQKSQLLVQWLFSWFLFLLAGYGYRVGRAFIAYLITIITFGLIFGIGTGGSSWVQSFVESINVFHGRGISTDVTMKMANNDLLLSFAGLEAIIGLVIEVTFIAALTQRFFGK